jgi:hypothetical protein
LNVNRELEVFSIYFSPNNVVLTKFTKYPELTLAALALGALYFALMSGHLHSIDGLFVYRQGEAFTYEHSFFFSKSLWPGAPWLSSKYGIGLSILYIPGLLLTSWMHPYAPMYGGKAFDWVLYYMDPYYAWAGTPVHVIITVAAAYLVALVCRELGLSRVASLWALALYGIGSPALIYARGDWNQQLEALCWIAAIYGALRFRRTSESGAWLCSIALAYALLTRPAEGVLISGAVLLLMLPSAQYRKWSSADWRGIILASVGFCVGFGTTLVVNWARYGSPFIFGYENEGWTTPLWVGLIGSTISPVRGILWEFPAVVLIPLGLRWAFNTPYKKPVILLMVLAIVQLINVAAWMWWWGGWDFGLRLFVPALPVVAVLAACGLMKLPSEARNRTPIFLMFIGLLFSIPCVLTDLAAGYGFAYDGTAESLRIDGYPLLSAFQYLHHIFATGPLDLNGIDILWVRLAGQTGGLSLVPMVLLLALAAALAAKAVASVRAIMWTVEGEQRDDNFRALPIPAVAGVAKDR